MIFSLDFLFTGTVPNPENPTALMINPAQTFMLVQALQKVKESAAKVGSDHRDLHSSVSKIGKSIDRSFVADYDSTSRDDVFRLVIFVTLNYFEYIFPCFFYVIDHNFRSENNFHFTFFFLNDSLLYLAIALTLCFILLELFKMAEENFFKITCSKF